jgi:hypothetical protein
MMPVTAPTIGRLRNRPRQWAFRRIKAGIYGPVIVLRGRVPYVDLAAVELVEGIKFPPERLAAAGIHIPSTTEARDGR